MAVSVTMNVILSKFVVMVSRPKYLTCVHVMMQHKHIIQITHWRTVKMAQSG